jgi:hypothetical protein
MEWLIALAAGIPALTYFLLGGGKGKVWGLVPAGVEQRGPSVYRGALVVRWKEGAAPLVVRVAALSSFFLGQMVVPGALAALVGLIVMFGMLASGEVQPVLLVSALSGPTGLIVAGYLLSAGSALLKRDEGAAAKARRASAWSLWHNGILIGLMLLALAGSGSDSRGDMIGFAAATLIYGGISIAQACLLRKAASALESYSASAEEASAEALPSAA